jgi:ATP-dependent Clp protease ATP-binding subunit ClpC
MSSNGYNFTARVRNVLARSRELAHERNHPYVGTEHLLLGIIAEGEGVSATVLQVLNISFDHLKQQVDAQLKRGQSNLGGPDLPYTSSAKRVLELSMAEARDLKHSYVGTEHLLLGLLREEKGIAAQVLVEAGVTIQDARREILKLLGGAAHEGASQWPPQFDRRRESPEAKRVAPDPPERVESVTIVVDFVDGATRSETFPSTIAALGYLGAVHRRQMDG